MTNQTTIRLEGAKEMLRTLEAADEKLASRTLGKALRRGSAPVLADMKRLASRETGALRDSLTVAFRGKKANRYAVLGPDKNAVYITPKGRRRPSRYAHLVENGHSGTVAANPFIRPAVDQNHERVIDIMADTIKTDLERAVAKGRVPRG